MQICYYRFRMPPYVNPTVLWQNYSPCDGLWVRDLSSMGQILVRNTSIWHKVPIWMGTDMSTISCFFPLSKIWRGKIASALCEISYLKAISIFYFNLRNFYILPLMLRIFSICTSIMLRCHCLVKQIQILIEGFNF